ncbi:hypothetical protein GY12_18550 [Micrococcus luteus]|nr:hypothetical protein GY12_18550 [Micrococcus luteus]
MAFWGVFCRSGRIFMLKAKQQRLQFANFLPERANLSHHITFILCAMWLCHDVPFISAILLKLTINTNQF